MLLLPITVEDVGAASTIGHTITDVVLMVVLVDGLELKSIDSMLLMQYQSGAYQ